MGLEICLVNSYYPPWIGGAETYVSNLAQTLSKRGNRVTIYCSSKPLKSDTTLQDGIKVVRMRTPLTFYGTPLVLFPASIVSNHFDIIHANFPSPFLASISASVSSLRKIPSVLTWHNDLPPVTSGAGMLVKIHDLVSPCYLSRFDRIIATTLAYTNKSKTLSRYMRKVRVIRNGVDTKKFNPSVSGYKVRQEYRLWKNKIILFVGALTRWHAYKGVDILILAFNITRKKYPDAALLLVGEGELAGEYRKLVAMLGLQEKVIFAGRVSDDRLPEYYAACDLAVLPSKDSSEGFGLTLIEAMATGKSVIGSSVGGIVDVISPGENGLLVAPQNIEDLAEAMNTLLNNEDLRTSLGSNGRLFAEHFDWHKVSERVEILYKEIL
jgi:glycosyltransferase involved in cell wall biosynthesis